MRDTVRTARRGSPLVVLAVVAVAWIGGRAAIWENPFAQMQTGLPPLLAQAEGPPLGSGAAPAALSNPQPAEMSATDPVQHSVDIGDALIRLVLLTRTTPVFGSAGQITGSNPYRMETRVAAGHQMLLAAALSYLPDPESFRRSSAGVLASGQPPYAPPSAPNTAMASAPDRWSLDIWAFWRQGSNASAISQGRVPIYGASQVGASLQFRLAPGWTQDPRVYARAYRALVSNGETEVAAGLSARPFAALPLRAQAELRLTQGRLRTEARPAAFVVTELAPQRLPGGLVAEAYAQGGYVGGTDATAFADGQLSVTRQLAEFDLAKGNPTRVSIGAGAWGGAQRDATRVDLGPTMRVDLTIGKVPARLSLDWREQVAGDAAPNSGVAATLSTRF